MNIFKQLYKLLCEQLGRFLFVAISSVTFSIVNGIQIINSFSDSNLASKMLFALMLQIFLSFFLTLGFEYFLKDKFVEKKNRFISLFVQAFVFVISLLLFIFCVDIDSPYFICRYYAILISLFVGSLLILSKSQSFECLIPNFINSLIVSFILCFCFVSGVMIVFWAFETLLISLDNDWYLVLLSSSSIISFFNFFVAYFTRKGDQISITKVFTVIVKKVLFSLYLILLLVLYLYLIKSLVVKQMPVGKINWFVSFATILYLFFYLSLGSYKGEKVIDFFYKYGFIPLISLVLLQCYSFGIRINAYGYTSVRYASLLYIIFSVIFIFLTVFRSGKNYRFIYVAFICLSLFAAFSPWNLMSFPVKNQISRIESILKSHGLFDEEKKTIIIPDNLGSILTNDEIIKIKDSFNEIYFNKAYLKTSPSWLNIEKDESLAENFENIFKIEDYSVISDVSDGRKQIFLYGKTLYTIDVSKYKTITKLYNHVYKNDNGNYVFKENDVIYDISGLINDIIKDPAKYNEKYKQNGELFIYSINDEVDLIIEEIDVCLDPDGTYLINFIIGYIAK